MIKANELRVGNLVTIAHETNSPIVEVETIHPNFINVFDDRRGYDLDFVMPIKLTEDWLVRLGFEKREDNRFIFYNVGKLVITYHKNKLLQVHYGIQRIGDDSKFTYVHQLQNLYFALTGQELTVK